MVLSNTISWQLQGDLQPDVGGVLTYQAVRPIPSPTPKPTGLHIVKSGPDYARPGGDVTYVLTVTNFTSSPLSDLRITDLVTFGCCD